MTRIKVEGLRDLDAALAQLTKAAAKGVGRRILKAAAEPMRAAAQAGAPMLTGRLQASVAVSTRVKGGDAGRAAFGAALRGGADIGAARAAARSANRGKSEVQMYMGPAGNVRQAVPQEFGTEQHPAQPFMRPAWDGHKDKALQIITDGLGAEIDKAVVRAAKRAARLAAKGT